jgi:hypothetical protein
MEWPKVLDPGAAWIAWEFARLGVERLQDGDERHRIDWTIRAFRID